MKKNKSSIRNAKKEDDHQIADVLTIHIIFDLLGLYNVNKEIVMKKLLLISSHIVP